MTTANKITLIRVGMIPFFIYFAYQGTQTCDIIALCIFLLASMTDALDGYIARHYNQITDFGKFVDPLADKLLVCAALLLFIQRSEMNSVMVFIILAREFIITSLRIVAIGKGRVLAAAWSGKVKTAGTMVCICLMLAFQGCVLDWVCTAVIVITTVYSGIEYFVKNKDVINWRDM